MQEIASSEEFRQRMAQKEIQAQLVQESELFGILQKAGVGERYFGAKVNSFDVHTAGQRHAKQEIMDFINGKAWTYGRGGVFIGSPAMGKTFLLCAMLKEVARRGLTIGHLSLNAFFLELRDSFKSKRNTEREVLAKYLKPKVLVIEDIQGMKNKDDEWQYKVFFMLLDGRYEQNKSTFATSNKTSQDIQRLLDAQTLRRFAGKLINFDERDHD